MSNFGIAILSAIITLFIFIIGMVIYGVPLLYLFYAANGVFVEWITSKFGKAAREHSARFANLLILFVFLEIAFLISIIFGAYKLISSLIKGERIINFTIEKPVNSYDTLLVYVIILFAFNSALLIRYLYITIRLYKKNKESIDAGYYKNLRLSLITYVFFFIYSIGFYYYFSSVGTRTSLGVLPSLAGYFYFSYLLFHLCKSSYFYIKYRKHIFPNFKLKDAINIIPFYIFGFAFIYFFYCTAQYLWFF